jgi:N-methylhydantoinase A
MRYVGQVHECTVDIDHFKIDASSIGQIKDAFHDRHEQLFTYAERHNPIELVNIESTLFGRVERPNPAELSAGGNLSDAVKGERDAILSADGTSTKVTIYDGAKLGAGSKISGPAIIEEETATFVVQPEWQVELHKSASYIFTRKR